MSRAAPSTHNSRSMCDKCSEIYFGFQYTADMAGLAAGTTRSRMTLFGRGDLDRHLARRAIDS
jgi:hypothetical protein